MTIARHTAFAVLLLLALAPARAADDGWVAVDSADGTFHFASPSAPQVKTLRIGDGPAGRSRTVYSLSSGDMVAVGQYTVFDVDRGSNLDPHLVLDGFMKGLSGSLDSNDDAPYTRAPGDTLPGLSAAAHNASLSCRIRIATDSRHIYVVSACWSTGAPPPPDVERIMTSFRVTKGA